MDMNRFLQRDAGGHDEPSALFEATVARSPDGTEVMVTIDSVGDDHLYGPCPYMPRGDDDPSIGDRAWVAFSDENDPVVVCWVPA